MTPRFECTEVFLKNYESKKRVIINRGGTRSSKTFSLMQLFIIELFEGRNKTLSIVRKTFPALRASVMRELIAFLHEKDLYKYLKHDKSNHILTYGTNILEFFSLDSEQKVRGRKRTHLWINEANDISFEEFQQLIFRTSVRAYLDFNPDDEGVWINTELEQKRATDKGDVDVFVSSYRDNPFLGKEEKADIEYLKTSDREAWAVFGEGQYGRREGVVFENFTIVNNISHDAKFIAYGLDFGFTHDPTAIVGVWMQDGKLWVREMLFERRLTNKDIADRLAGLSIGPREEIICDSAEPKSIEELYRHGYRAVPALKGADSIKAGIDTLKGYELMVTSDSVNLTKELRTYKWKKDKDGKPMNEPVDFANHLIDGLRYVALNKLHTRKKAMYAIR